MNLARQHTAIVPWLVLVAALCALPVCSGAEAVQGKSLVVPNGSPGFSLLSPQDTGVRFTNFLAQQRHLTNLILLNGSGVACGDVDGDGKTDLYFNRLDGPNALFRNLGGWKFEEITDAAGVACEGIDATGALLADIDGDGDLDLLVNSIGHGTHIFLNDGKGVFTKSTALNGVRGGTSSALADLDGNGTLDLYIANYRTVSLNDQPNTPFNIRMTNGRPEVTMVGGRPITDPDLIHRFNFKFTMRGGSMGFVPEENGEADAVYLNNGKGAFAPLSFTNGAFLDESGVPLSRPPLDWGLTVMLRDLNGDGAPDIYVCNDFKTPDRIWINDGRGGFRAIPPHAIRQTCLSSMGVDVADINRDGLFDIFVVDMLSREHQRRLTQKTDLVPDIVGIGDTASRVQSARNTLLLARADGTFAEIAQYAGIESAEWAWTPVFLDVDLDGYEDLLISNGFERDPMNVDVLAQIEALKTRQRLPPVEQLGLRRIFPRLETPNVAFRNLGNLRFSDMSREWRFDARGISQGMALADFDNDGDLDVVINNFNGPAMLFRNDGGAPRVAVRLRGTPPNTHGIGAKIAVTGGPAPQMQEMISGGRYLSSDDYLRVFAAGSATNRLRIEVTWRSGKVSVVENAEPNSLCEIDESTAVLPERSNSKTRLDAAFGTNVPPLALFEDMSARLAHRHVEEPFDDFVRQPLLPHKLSQGGPGVGWFDLDGDGFDELIVGSGRSGALAVFRNVRDGTFKRIESAPFNLPVTRDQTTVLGWRNAARSARLVAGSANYEDGLRRGGVARVYDAAAGTVEDALPPSASSTGPLAMADLDGDGTLELFVGGRALPGRFPEAASSLMFRQAGRDFVLDHENTRALTNAGLIAGAVFSDLDADGFPELVLACEWGPIRVFGNRAGKLTDHTAKWGLSGFVGWWNGVIAADFDADGKMDLAASNWGRNTKYETFRGSPLRLYHGDFDGDGSVEIFESYFDLESKRYVPLRNLEAALRGMPSLRTRFDTWQSFARASIEEVLGEHLRTARVIEANWLETTVFLNRGGRFEPVVLPPEAQFSPAFGICAADFDGDGNEDLFLAQNFFAVPTETSRYDAGRGLLLRGDGKGGFAALHPGLSGIAIDGEQRGAAVCDFDGDGRVDLAVGQNGAETKLFRNGQGKPGLRVRLAGPPGNSAGVGAILRTGDGTNFGAAREIHSGSGYWSQDSAVQVMRRGDVVQVRWPGAKTAQAKIPAHATEVSIDAAGLKVLRSSTP